MVANYGKGGVVFGNGQSCVLTFSPSSFFSRARQMTTGVQCIEFQLDGYKFTILDAGGQRSQRQDWSSFFDGLDAFIFVVAISEYDMVLAEDRATNRMHESLQG